MNYSFTLDELPGQELMLRSSIWTGKVQLFVEGNEMERSAEKGRPFIVPGRHGEVRIRVKQTFPDYSPKLFVNNRALRLERPLVWHEYLVSGLPILLLFVGGALGGGIGMGASLYNFQHIRKETTLVTKYLTIAGITIGAFLAYILLAWLVDAVLP